MLQYGDYQMEIYRAGLNGRLPKLPVDFRELEERAHAAMPPGLVSYVAGGCGNEHTQSINVSAFERWGLIPRMSLALPADPANVRWRCQAGYVD